MVVTLGASHGLTDLEIWVGFLLLAMVGGFLGVLLYIPTQKCVAPKPFWPSI